MPPLLLLRARRLAKTAAPLALQLKHWWDNLTPEQKERYRAQARRYAERGRGAIEQRRRGSGGRGRRR